MPTHASTAKRARQNIKRRSRNRTMKSMVKTAEKKVRHAQNRDQALPGLVQANSMLDKAAAKGILHRRTAARHKSRLAKRVNTIAAASAEKSTDK